MRKGGIGKGERERAMGKGCIRAVHECTRDGSRAFSAL